MSGVIKKKILIVDPLSYKGHANYDYGIIRIISSIFDYGIIINSSVAEFIKGKGISDNTFERVYPDEWSLALLSKRMHKLFYHIAYRYYYLRLLLITLLVAKKYDYILFLRVDPFIFSIFSYFFGNNCYVVDHGAGSIESDKLYRFAWRITNSKVKIIVLENFIQEMVNKTLKKHSVYVVKHPLPALPSINEKGNVHIRGLYTTIFAPSGSNDEKFVQSLLSSKIPSDVKIVIKSAKTSFSSLNLMVYSHFLTIGEYNDFFRESDIILLPYEPSYNYRISAVLFEALTMNKVVFILSNNTLKYYKDVFGDSVVVFDSLEDMFSKIQHIDRAISLNNKKLLKDYSDDAIAKELYAIFN